MASDTYSDVFSMAVILLGVIVLFGVLWLLMRKCGLGPPAVVEPCDEVAAGGAVDQPQKAASVSPGGAPGSVATDQRKAPPDLVTPDVGNSPDTCGTLSPSQRIANVARRASVAVSRAVKQETGAILQALSSGADVMQVPSDNASESEGPAASGKEGNAKSTEAAAASDKDGHTEDTKLKKTGSSLSKDNKAGQTSKKEDDVGDATAEKPTQSKDDDGRDEKSVMVEPQSASRGGAAQQGQPPPQPTGPHIGPSADDATATAAVSTSASAKEPLPLPQNDNNASPISGAAGAQLSLSQDADVVTSAEHRTTKGESRRKSSQKRTRSPAGSVSQSLAQSEVKSDPGSRHTKRKWKSPSRSENKTQP